MAKRMMNETNEEKSLVFQQNSLNFCLFSDPIYSYIYVSVLVAEGRQMKFVLAVLFTDRYLLPLQIYLWAAVNLVDSRCRFCFACHRWSLAKEYENMMHEYIYLLCIYLAYWNGLRLKMYLSNAHSVGMDMKNWNGK